MKIVGSSDRRVVGISGFTTVGLKWSGAEFVGHHVEAACFCFFDCQHTVRDGSSPREFHFCTGWLKCRN